MAFNPKVSDEYYNYYISKTIDLSPKEISNLQPISPNVAYNHNSIKHIGFLRGWSYPEITHRWSNAKYAEIIFKIVDTSQFEGKINISIFPHEKQSIVIFLNEHIIYSSLHLQQSTLEINFDKKILKNGINRLSFQIPDAKKPASPDPRLLGIAFTNISLK